MHEGRGYIPIDQVLEKIQRVNPWLTEINFYDACDYLDELYGLVGAPNVYLERTTGNSLIRPHIEIQGYAGELPIDFLDVNPGGVRDASDQTVYQWATGSFRKAPSLTGKSEKLSTGDKRYYIENGLIYTNKDNVTLQLSYKAMPIDDRGFPLVPNRPKFIEAAKWYIAEQEAWKKWSVGKLSDKVYKEVTANSAWYQGAAGTEAKNPHPDRLESFKNMFSRLYPKVDFQQSSFKFAGV